MDYSDAIRYFVHNYNAILLRDDLMSCYKALGFLEAMQFLECNDADNKFIKQAEAIVITWIVLHAKIDKNNK